MSGKAHFEVVILHGWSNQPDTASAWQPFQAELKKRGAETTFLRMPGWETPLTKPWTLADYADWLAGELQGKKSVLLLGHSFGGQLAVYYTAHHPDQVARLILIAASGMRNQSWLSRLKRTSFKWMAQLGKGLFPASSRRWLYRLARAQDYYQASPVMRATMAQVIAVEVGELAAQITIPTLLIWGRGDTQTPIWIADRYHQLIPNSELVVIDGARHAPHVTQAALTAEQVWSWLQAN